MNNKFSKFWLVFILLALMAGGILAWQYLIVPKEETANWKTYVNAYLEVKYPTDYFYFFQPGNQSIYEKFKFANDTDFVGSFDRNPGSTMSIQDKIYQKGGYEWPRVEISMSQPTQLPVTQWAADYLKDQRPNIKFSQTTKNINGKNVLIMSAYDSDTGPLIEQHNFIVGGNRIVLISCILGDPQCTQILSTFKFTNTK